MHSLRRQNNDPSEAAEAETNDTIDAARKRRKKAEKSRKAESDFRGGGDWANLLIRFGSVDDKSGLVRGVGQQHPLIMVWRDRRPLRPYV